MALNTGGFVSISFQLGEDPVTITRKLAAWNAKITTMAPAWQDIGQDMLNDFMDNILGEGGGFGRGSRWPALARSTVRERIRLGYGGAHPMEWRTGVLLREFAFRGAPGNVFIVGDNSLVVGGSSQNANWQHFGTARMPARQLIGVSFRRKSKIVDKLNTYVAQQAAAAELAYQQGSVDDGGGV